MASRLVKGADVCRNIGEERRVSSCSTHDDGLVMREVAVYTVHMSCRRLSVRKVR